MSVYDIARPEIRDLVPYAAPDVPDGFTRLNANEAGKFPYPLEYADGQNRYPQMRPNLLRSALAGLFDVGESALCPARGSSEGIDLLVRTFCRAYRDNIVVQPPAFEMYSAYAAMQAAEVRQVPLLAEQDFAVDWQSIDRQCDDNTKIVFLCSPNNPTGNSIPAQDILQFAERSRGRLVVVVDEAYIEFSDHPSLSASIGELDNLVILRTLSKAYALAGARCGALIGSDELVRMTSALLSPYALSGPVTELVLAALRPENVQLARRQIDATVLERQRLNNELQRLAIVQKIWPSDANFLLVRLDQLETVQEKLASRRVLLRVFDQESALANCARITVGSRADNDILLETLATVSEVTM